MTPRTFLFTSEQVSEGHPDKICDQISDRILDTILAQDKVARVAADVAIKDNTVFLLGEISTTATVDYNQIVRDVLREIGYEDAETSCDWRTVEIINRISNQSPDIYQAVFRQDELCAGDQGIMIGYASQETKALMPATHLFANILAMRLTRVRKMGILTFLRPDSKTQVTIKYEEDPLTKELRPVFLDTLIISTMHTEEVDNTTLRTAVFKHVVIPTLKQLKDDEGLNLQVLLPGCEDGNLEAFDYANWPIEDICRGHYGKCGADQPQYTKLLINPSDRFVIGGPKSDCGLTGRKVIADSYGSFGSHGGGAFSGKDASKVDRSGAYLARNIAMSLCSPMNNICKRCMVQLGYAIGVAEPVSIFVEMYGSELEPEYADQQLIEKAIRRTFGLTPGKIIQEYGLDTPIFFNTSRYGHFGRPGLPWEQPRRLILE